MLTLLNIVGVSIRPKYRGEDKGLMKRYIVQAATKICYVEMSHLLTRVFYFHSVNWSAA